MRRSVLAFALLLVLACPSTASAEDSYVEVVSAPSVGNDAPDKPSNKPPSNNEVTATNWVNPCPQPQQRMYTSSYTREDGQYGYWVKWKCDLTSGWEGRWICRENCPAGKPDEDPGEVPPPGYPAIFAWISGRLRAPDPRFAPPAHRGRNLGPVVGKRLYVYLTPESFSEEAVETTFGGGYWPVRALIVPVGYRFRVGSESSAICTNTTNLANTAAGRKQLDAEGCSVIVTERDKDKTIRVSVVSYFRVILSTNDDSINRTIPLSSSVTFRIPVRQIQAVVG
jgi:hypothetical protein